MRWVGRILGGLLALALVVYLAVNLISWFSAWNNKKGARERLTTQLATVVPQAREHQRRVAEALGTPEHTLLVQRCEITTSDSGWMVQDYRQECVLEAIDAYAAPSLGQARRLVSGAPPDVVGDPVEEDAAEDRATGGCTTLRARGDEGGRRKPGETYLASFFLRPDPSGAAFCGARFQPSPYQPEQVLGGQHVALDTSRPWLLVSRATQLGDDSIGCSRWSILFCSQPSGLPVFGEAPQP